MNSPLFPVKDEPPARTRTNSLITRDTPLQAAMDRLSIPALWTIFAAYMKKFLFVGPPSDPKKVKPSRVKEAVA